MPHHGEFSMPVPPLREPCLLARLWEMEIIRRKYLLPVIAQFARRTSAVGS